MKKAAFFCIIVISALFSAGCWFFSSPLEFANPWDPRFETDGGWILDGDPFGKLAYEGRTGLPGMIDAAVNSGGNDLYVADRYKKAIYRFDVPGGGGPEKFVLTADGENGIGTIECIAVSNANGNDYLYVSDSDYVYRLDTWSGEQGKLYDEGRGYSIKYMDFADTDGNVYLLTERDGEYTVRWLDGGNGTQRGRFSPPEVGDPSGFAVSDSWVFIAEKGYGAIFIYNRNPDTNGEHGLKGEIYYDSAIPDYQAQPLTVPSTSADTQVQFFDCRFDKSSATISTFVENGFTGTKEIVASTFGIESDLTTASPASVTNVPVQVSHGGEISFSAFGDTSNGYFYLCEPHFGYIEEFDISFSNNITIHKNSTVALNANEFARVRDFKRYHASGDLYFIDGQFWQWQRYRMDDLSWDEGGHYGTPGTDPGLGDLFFPTSIAVNGSYVFVSNGGDAYIRRYTLDGTGDAVYGPNTAIVDKIIAFEDNTVLGWSNDFRELWAWDGTGAEVGPFYLDGDIQHVDFEKDGNDINWVAVNFWGNDGPGYSSFGTLNWDADAGDFVYEEMWKSAEEEWFSSGTAYNYTSEPYFIGEISVPGNGTVWAYFDNLSAAAKFTTDGELIGTFCLKDDFPGERWLPERYFNFSRSEDGENDRAEIGGIAADENDTLWVYDNGSHRLKKYIPDFPEEPEQ